MIPRFCLILSFFKKLSICHCVILIVYQLSKQCRCPKSNSFPASLLISSLTVCMNPESAVCQGLAVNTMLNKMWLMLLDVQHLGETNM